MTVDCFHGYHTNKPPFCCSVLRDRFRTVINVLGDCFGAGIVFHYSKADLQRMDEEDRAQQENSSDSEDDRNEFPAKSNGRKDQRKQSLTNNKDSKREFLAKNRDSEDDRQDVLSSGGIDNRGYNERL